MASGIVALSGKFRGTDVNHRHSDAISLFLFNLRYDTS